MKRLFLASLLCVAWSLFADIIESPTISSIREWVDEGSIVVVDLNNTLMETAQFVGSDDWAAGEIAELMESTGQTKAEVLHRFVPSWHHILIDAKVRAVEPETALTINALQELGYSVIGLTNRYIEMAYPTHRQLQSIDIDLSRSTPYGYDLEIPGGSASKYIEGIIFVGLKNDKGETLFRFFDEISYSPKRVVFVDDKRRNLESVERACLVREVPFIGIRLSATDGRER